MFKRFVSKARLIVTARSESAQDPAAAWAIDGYACFQCLLYHCKSCVFISYNVCHVIKAESGAQQLNLCPPKALQQHMLCYQGVGRIAAQFVTIKCGWMINLIMTAQSILARDSAATCACNKSMNQACNAVDTL